MIRRAVKYKSGITKKPLSLSKKKRKAPVVVKAKPIVKPAPAPKPEPKLKERTPRREGVSYGDASLIMTGSLDEAMDYWRERSVVHYEYFRHIKEYGKEPKQLSVGGSTYSFDAVLWTAGRYRLAEVSD